MTLQDVTVADKVFDRPLRASSARCNAPLYSYKILVLRNQGCITDSQVEIKVGQKHGPLSPSNIGYQPQATRVRWAHLQLRVRGKDERHHTSSLNNTSQLRCIRRPKLGLSSQQPKGIPSILVFHYITPFFRLPDHLTKSPVRSLTTFSKWL